MQYHTVKVSKEGRVLLPVSIRTDLGLREGSTLSLRVENGETRLFDKAQALRRAQAIASQYKKSNGSVVEDLLKNRRDQVNRE
jgi:AbrB family looped-hinge helix DNA binding protein